MNRISAMKISFWPGIVLANKAGGRMGYFYQSLEGLNSFDADNPKMYGRK